MEVIILGSAKCAPEDFKNARNIAPKAEIMVLNLSWFGILSQVVKGELIVKHWVSLYCDIFVLRRWMKPKPITHTNLGDYSIDRKMADYIDRKWDFNHYGSVGMFATKVALGLCYDKIILAGCPIDDSGHFYDFENTKFEFDERTIATWKEFKDKPESVKVRSMSGLTKELLGAPDGKWLGNRLCGCKTPLNIISESICDRCHLKIYE
ncbi:MAG: hypothetical protein WC444_07210 [Candidatus Paceibacterota bacterium]